MQKLWKILKFRCLLDVRFYCSNDLKIAKFFNVVRAHKVHFTKVEWEIPIKCQQFSDGKPQIFDILDFPKILNQWMIKKYFQECLEFVINCFGVLEKTKLQKWMWFWHKLTKYTIFYNSNYSKIALQFLSNFWVTYLWP